MKKEQRQAAIVALIHASPSDHILSTNALADHFEVSEMTLRRDLTELAAAGLIQRQHGGAKHPERESKPLAAAYRVGILMVSRGMKFSDPFFNEVIEATDSRLQELGCQVAYIHALAEVNTVERARGLLHSQPVDGIIMVGTHRAYSIGYFKDHTPFLVSIVGSLDPIYDSITFDGNYGIRQIVDHLVSLGYRRLGFITGHYDDREQGFLDSITAHHLDDDPALRITVREQGTEGWTPELGRQGAKELMQRARQPDAIVCASDRLAIGAIQWLHQQGLRVPDDIAVTGCDNIRDSAFTIPALTTVHVHKRVMGKLAAERLVRRMENPDEIPLRICTPTYLIVRESCGSQLNQTK